MEAPPYDEILKSPTFKFVVGKAKEELFLHSTLVASKSEVLGKMIKGPFIEGQQGYAALADEDVQTVAAFAEFIYTGDYKIRKDTSQCDGGTPVHPSRRDEDHKQIIIRPTNVHWKKFTKATEYGSFGYATSFSRIIDTDDSDYFIPHAKIFIFADCYGVAELLDLALQKLHGAFNFVQVPALEEQNERYSGPGALLLRKTGSREAEEAGGVVLGRDYRRSG
ncbi:uncharacterized protein CPUR_05403 [Claviceps purpurea 20.1]|uniref:BTB domain-containing protein n=1 Tax=Claviceps purpurea (strain 20.1) TaxID=1111077 RepID=M1W844_CLAP2|nr:uncharacterized protein CPUR_05403 [Claviceps purpurea 20.1]